MKKKTTHFLNGGSFRLLLKKEVNKYRRSSILKDLKILEKEKKDKEYLKKSLEKIKFYDRKIKYKTKRSSKKLTIIKKIRKRNFIRKRRKIRR